MDLRKIPGLTGVLLAVILGLVLYIIFTEPLSDSVGPSEAPHGHARFHAKIAMARTDHALDVQLLEFATGDAAERAALEEGACSLRAIEDNECLPNGFFLRTTNTSLTLPLAPDARVLVYDLTNPSGIMLQQISLDALFTSSQWSAVLETRPFILTTHGGVITEIEEQYIP